MIENQELLQLLSDVGLPRFYKIFLEENVSAKSIWNLTGDDLRGIGLKLGDIKEFDAAKQKYEGIKLFWLVSIH